MSQVRKLLEGNKIPKAQQGYKFQLDSQEYNVTDDQLKEIDNLISTLDPKHRRFLGNWTKAIKEGNSEGNRASNTVTLNMISGVEGRDLKRLKKQKGSIWETLGEKDSYYAKEAIGEALNITASVLNNSAPKEEVKAPSKTKISNSKIDLDFNDGVFSATAGENANAKNRIKQIMEHVSAGDASQYDTSAWTNLDAIKAILEANPKYADEMWERMSKPGYEYSAEDEDFLRNFGINYNFAKQTTPVASGDQQVQKPTVVTGNDGKSYKVGDIFVEGDKTYKITGIDTNGKVLAEEIEQLIQEETPETPENIEPQNVITIDNDSWNPEKIWYRSPLNGIGPMYGLTFNASKKYLELQKIGEIQLPFSTFGSKRSFSKQNIMKDINNNIFSIGEDGIICKLDSEYYAKILTGLPITYNDWHRNTKVIAREHKQGGTIFKHKTDAFKDKFKDVVKGQDGVLLPNISSKSVEDLPITYKDKDALKLAEELKRIQEEQGRKIIISKSKTTDKDGNSKITIQTIENPIPEEIAATVANPIEVESNTLDENAEQVVIVRPENLVEKPIVSEYEPLKFNDINRFSSENKLQVPMIPLTKQKVLPLKTNKKKDFNDLVGVLEQLLKYKKGGILKAQTGLQFTRQNLNLDWTLINDSGIDRNIIAYRPGVDWGTYRGVNGMGYYTSVVDISPAPMYYTTPGAYYMGAKEAINDKLKEEINRKSPRADLNYYKYQEVNPTLAKEDEEKEVLPEGALKPIGYVDPTKRVGMKLDADFKNPKAYEISYEEPGIKRTSSLSGNNSEELENIGGYSKNVSGLYKYLIPALSLARFGLNAHFQNKYRDQAVAALNAGRFNEIAAWANTPRQDSPALDRELQQIRSERMAGIKPVTSDLIANNALQNEREAKLYDRERDIVGRQSQFEWNASKEALDIMNHNIANQVAVANSNRARTAAVNSAIKQQDMELTQRRAQSWENLGLEIQNNLQKDKNTILNYKKAQEQSRLQKEHDRIIDQIFGAQARNNYRSLSADKAANYTDYDDYLNKEYNDIYRKNIDRITKAREDLVNNMTKWLYLNGLNYSYPTFVTGKSSAYGYKKGGYLRGSTRYRLEPDEQIWVDNNKATHQAIAKLSDNTIKLLLRALK